MRPYARVAIMRPYSTMGIIMRSTWYHAGRIFKVYLVCLQQYSYFNSLFVVLYSRPKWFQVDHTWWYLPPVDVKNVLSGR